MKKKIYHYLLMFITVICTCFMTGCKKTYVNEIITRTVEYEENVTVYDLEDAIVEAVEKGTPSVVGIEVSSLINKGFGSGVIIRVSQNITGYLYYVVTNFHVISYNNKICSEIKVYLGEYKEKITSKCVAYDKDLDLAIIQFSSPRKLQVATIGNSEKYQKGRYAIAIGNPYDMEVFYDTVTVGNVSDPSREVTDKNGKMNFYIQHTAPINSGNSGGGLFDLHGNLMGINTWKFAETDIEGMGFAVPIHIVKQRFPLYFK